MASMAVSKAALRATMVSDAATVPSLSLRGRNHPNSSRAVRVLNSSGSSTFLSQFVVTATPTVFKSIKLTKTTFRRPVTSVRAMISVGDKLPEATLSYLNATNETETVTVSELTAGKKVIFLAVPGAFTPTCSQKHLPGFVEKAEELKAKGIDTIACISVNDVFVMKAWSEKLDADAKVLLLSDGNGEFTKAMDVALDLSDKPEGLGVRSRRYAMYVEDGVAKVLNLEEGGAFTVSSAEEILKAL